MTISNKISPHIITPLLTLIPHISKGFIQHCGKRLENTNIFNLLFIRDKITIIRGFPQESVNNCLIICGIKVLEMVMRLEVIKC